MALDQQTMDIEELEQLFRTNKSSEVYVPLTEIYLRRGYPMKAIEVCKKGIQSDDTVEGHLLLAQAYFDASASKRSYLKDASQEADYVLSRNSDSWDAYRLQGEIAILNDDLQGAIKSLKTAHDLNPSHPQARRLLESLGVESDGSEPEDYFYINVETGFIAPQEDSALKMFRDISLFMLPILIGVYLYASNSVLGRKVHSLTILGRTQQRIDTYTGLKKALKIYKTILQEKFDKNHPFAIIHLAESHYSLWKYHERTQAHYDAYVGYFTRLQKLRQNPRNRTMINRLARWHALSALRAYDQALDHIRKGERDKANEVLEGTDKYIKSWLPKLPPSAWIYWVHGLIYESLNKLNYASANFKRAAEMGWNTPKFRWRQGMHFMRVRNFSTAHNKFKQATEQGQQNESLVRGELSDPAKQKNENCWIDPPLLLGPNAKPGLQLTVTDMLIDGLNSAIKADLLPQCSYHPQFQKYYAASKLYLPSPLMDALSVLDSGVGMSAAFELIEDVKKDKEKVKKNGDLSPHLEAWYQYLLAKMYWYQSKYDEARKEIAVSLKLAPYEPLFHSLNGMLQIKAKKYDDAQKSFNEAFKLDPDLVQSYYEGADQLLRVVDSEGKPTQNERVEKVLAVLKKNFSKHADYFYLKGRLEANKGNTEQALKDWAKALESERAPYFGYHYDASIEIGKIHIKDARKILAYKNALKNKKSIPKSDYEELARHFVKQKKALFAKIKDRLQTKDMEKHKKDLAEEKENFEKFVTFLKEKKTIRKKAMELYISRLAEVYYEDAGNHFQQAMKTRPGAVGARLWTGHIYLDNERYQDASGHFDVATAGFVRDLDFDGAKQAYKNLLLSKIGDKKDKNNRDWPANISKFFQQKIFILLTQGATKVNAKKVKLISENKEEEAKKAKADPKDIYRSAKNIDVIAEVCAEEKKLEKLADEFKEDAKTLRKSGFADALRQAQKRAQEAASGGKKKSKRRRRRRRRRRR